MHSIIKKLIKKYRIRPLKQLGQNFLINEKVIKKIILASELKTTDTVLEVGPGFGAITREVVKRVKKLIAIEKDRKIATALAKELKNFSNLKIVNKDILKTNYRIPKNYKVVANLPFYISTAVIMKFLKRKNPPKKMVLIIQKEVAERMCAPQDYIKRAQSKQASLAKTNILSIFVKFYANPKIISYVPKESFWPQPEVDAALIKITPHKKYKIDPTIFSTVVGAGFSHPRKQIINNLTEKLARNRQNKLKLNKEQITFLLLKNKIRPSQRPETLTINDWIRLTRGLCQRKIKKYS